METNLNFHEETPLVEVYSSSVSNVMDSKMSHLDDVLLEKLENAFHKQTSQVCIHNVAKIASEHDPIDLAYAVTRLPTHARIIVYDNLPDIHAKIIFMIETGSNTRAAIFREIDDREIISLIECMPTDEAVRILDDLSNRRLKRILDQLDVKKAARIREQQKHDRHSAGRIMTDEFFSFPMHTTIASAASYIRDNPGIDLTRRIFVVSQENELIGYVPARNLIVNPGDVLLRQIMRPVLHTVTPEASRDEVVDLVSRYKVSALPVIDGNNQLLGVVTYEDVVETLEDIADETIANIAGTAEDLSENEPIFSRFLSRAPWLLVTVCAGLFTASVMSHFNLMIWYAFVSFFVPLISGMSGNVGIVCSTVLVRGISTGEISSGTRNQAIAREVSLGFLVGSFFGVICAIIVYTLNHLNMLFVGSDPLALSLMVFAGVFGACMSATCLGVFCPFFFARMRIDPAVASGPIVTAFNDVIATILFFVVAQQIFLFLS